MALNFPNPALQTPLNEFSPDSTPAKSTNGVTYIWTNNEKWVASYVVFNDIYVNVSGDNMTGDLTLGTDKITLNATDGSAEFAGDLVIPDSGYRTSRGIKLYNTGIVQSVGVDISNVWMGFNTSDGPTGVATSSILANGSARFDGNIQSTSQNGGQLAGFRNQIINGDFRIWQRGDGFYNQKRSNNQFTSDRWRIFCADDNSGGGFHVAKDNDAPNGFTYSAKIVNASGVDVPGYGAATYFQKVENLKRFSGGEFTLSCLVKASSVNTAYFKLTAVTNYGTGGSPSPAESQVSATKSQSVDFNNTSWTQVSWTFDIADLTGKVFGTDNNSFLDVGLSGIGLMQSQSVSVTGFQLEPGPVATPFEHRPIGTELALCQRYYQKVGIQGQVICQGGGVVGDDQVITLPCTALMRVYSPTFSFEKNGANAPACLANTVQSLGTDIQVFAVRDANEKAPVMLFRSENTSANNYKVITTTNVLLDAEL